MSENLKIDPYGFREYDARWVYEKDINRLGITNLGKGLGTQIIKHTLKNNPRVIVGHDYRSYSEDIKSALKEGLISTGCFVEDIGLSLSPMVYFAQFNLNADAVGMVTASHNENGGITDNLLCLIRAKWLNSFDFLILSRDIVLDNFSTNLTVTATNRPVLSLLSK